MNKSKRKLRINFKLRKLDAVLILTVSLLMLFVLVLFSVYTKNVRTSEEELISLVLERMSVNQKVQFEEYIDEKVQTLKGLASLPDVYKMKDADVSALLKGRASKFGFEYFFIMKANGTGYYFDEGGVYRDQKNESFFKDVMENDVYLTQPFYTDKGPAITTVCVSIRNSSFEKVGVLCGALNLESIQSIIENNELVLEGDSFILNESGNYISSNNSSDLHDKASNIYQVPDSKLALITDAFNAEEDRSGNIVINNVEYKAYVSYLSDFNWVLVQIIPMTEVTARFQYIEVLQQIMAILTVALFFCILRIIYSWKKSDTKIYTDTLTGCNSRAACLSLLESLENKRKMRISIIYMDLNKFKYANDTYGHDEGDRLLRIFGKALNRVFGKIGFVGRLGGDEFIAILADATDSDIEAMCAQVEAYLQDESKNLSFPYVISASYGYASRDAGQKETLDDIQRLADEKMYKQKAKKNSKAE